jgi:carbon storage regulator
MLVLSRKIGDRLVIAESIEITVVQIRGNKVRLGVTAPRQVSVRRHEVTPETRHEVPAGTQSGLLEEQSPAPNPQETRFEFVQVGNTSAHATDHEQQNLIPG